MLITFLLGCIGLNSFLLKKDVDTSNEGVNGM